MDIFAMDQTRIDIPLSLQDGAEIIGRWAMFAKNRYAFLTRSCYTQDEVDRVNPVKLLPRKPHIQLLTQLWEREPLMVVVKSRRMQVTWQLLGLDLHMALFEPHSVTFIVSDEQVKSDRLLGRLWFILKNIPERSLLPEPKVHLGKEGDPTRIDFPGVESSIVALSQDPEDLRQEGATLIHAEEIGSWKWPEKSWEAMLPTVQGGGKLVVVGTARAGTFFEQLVKDDLSVPVGG
jgi:hypothetical protein